jgi:hypothetical protein
MPGKATLYVLDIERGVHDDKADEFKERLKSELDDGTITQKEYSEIMSAFIIRLKKVKENK